MLHKRVLLALIIRCCCAPLRAERSWRQKIEMARLKRVAGVLDALKRAIISVNIVPGFSKQHLSMVKVKVSATHSCWPALKRACLSARASAVLSTINEIRQNNVGQAESNIIRLIQELVAESDCTVLIQRALTLLHAQHSGECWNIAGNLFKPNSNLLFSIYRNLIKKKQSLLAYRPSWSVKPIIKKNKKLLSGLW